MENKEMTLDNYKVKDIEQLENQVYGCINGINAFYFYNLETGEKIDLGILAHKSDLSFDKEKGTKMYAYYEVINKDLMKVVKNGTYKVEAFGVIRGSHNQEDYKLKIIFDEATVSQFEMSSPINEICRFTITIKPIENNFDLEISDKDQNVIIKI